MNVAIFGAGVAGLATAAALRALGHRCRIYEQQAEHVEAGMAFILMPDAIERLQALQMHLSEGVVLHHYAHCDAQGRVLARHSMPAGARCLRRKDLLQAFMRTGLAVEPGSLAQVEQGAAGQVRRVRLGSGASVEADLYVAADGAHSPSRAALFPHWPAAPARVFEIVGLVEDAECARWAGHDFNKFHAAHGGLAFGLLPACADTLVWYLQFDARRLPADGLRDARALHGFVRECVGRWAPPIERVLARADFERAHLWRPIDADPVPCFHRGNFVLVGDAAHPLLPFSSQGVSAAIFDALALARLLADEPQLPRALARYSAERRSACLPYVRQGRVLTDRFLAPDGAADAIPIAY